MASPNVRNVPISRTQRLQHREHSRVFFCTLQLNQCSNCVLHSITRSKLCLHPFSYPINTPLNSELLSKKLNYLRFIAFLCFNKKLEKVGEKQPITSLSMYDREISPSLSEFNQGLRKPRPWFKFQPLW